jgi:hypothetical protein
MIDLTCTNCRKLLQIDDAFAGGVCRCKYCGTIQTVPSKKPRAAAPTTATAAPATTQSKALFHAQSSRIAMRGSSSDPPPGSGSGLDELAQIVASSGLAGTGLRSSHLRKAPPPPVSKNLKPILFASGAILAVAVAILITWLIMRSPSPSADDPLQDTPANQQLPTNNKRQTTTIPNYMGLPLSGPSVIYLLDRGSGTLETFDYLKRGAIKSIASLGPGTRFQILFWETDSLIEFPQGSMRYATAENVAATDEAIKDVYAFQQSKIEEPLKKALAQNPAEIVIVTGKYGLDDEFVNTVLALRDKNPVKIHTVSLGKSASPEALKKLASKTGGHFKEVSGSALAEYGN